MTEDVIEKSKILVVGAGGIGCELLKNLVLTGFKDIHVIDLDTIDFSNLNRQFLFRKNHVGKPKSLVAKESVEKFGDGSTNIKAYHDTVIKQEYNVEFFRSFDIILNALDNRFARNHVNRLCLAADRPLIESGTQGYLGQVVPILKGKSECYECRPKAAQKTFAGCTIRNTPSEPIHCIVWAKHLFNQLFGLPEDDEEVSPDSTDPELKGEVDPEKLLSNVKEDGNVERVDTRKWAAECGYDAKKIFEKLFHDDIVYLRTMTNLWEKRRAPEPQTFPENFDEERTGIRDQRVWSLKECAEVFAESVQSLKKMLENCAEGDYLVWDKDDAAALDFVTACANIRSEAFGIPKKNQFEIKSMAGNIIPAIATTNAVVAGLIVLQALKVLRGKSDDCKTVYLTKIPTERGNRIINAFNLDLPNPKCYACADKNEVFVRINTKSITMRTFRDKVLKGYLNMSAPDAVLEGRVLISSEEGESDHLEGRTLHELGVTHCSALECDDFLQNFSLTVHIDHSEDKLEDDQEFVVLAEAFNKKTEEAEQKNEDDDDVIEDDDEFCVVEEGDGDDHKRKADDDGEQTPAKRIRID